jgi:hypothetical protein
MLSHVGTRPHAHMACPPRPSGRDTRARTQRALGLLGQHSPQKASPLGVSTINPINHACPPTHNVGLFPTISPSHIVSRDLSEDVLGQPRSTWIRYQLLEPDPPTHSVSVEPPAHTARPTQAIGPRHTRPNT